MGRGGRQDGSVSTTWSLWYCRHGEYHIWKAENEAGISLLVFPSWQLRALDHFQRYAVIKCKVITSMALLCFQHRLFNPKCDALYIEDYPFLHFYNKMKRQTCQSCSKGAMWLTCDDELAPNSPCFFCLSCLVKLHYSGDGKKLCQFKLYRYQIPYALTVD